ncbi:MAG: Rieske (2Fe-2S) protein [Saprospiraceae bacterium]
MNHILLSDIEYQDLAVKTQQLIDEADQLPESYAKEIIFTLLEKFDLLHRESLSRLLKIIQEKSPALLNEMEKDFAVQSIFTLYDLFEIKQETSHAPPLSLKDALHEIESKIRMPIWIPAGNVSELEPGQIYFREFEGVKVLICIVDDELVAYQSNCPGSILSMEFGKIENGNLLCPWHGCIYDLRTGIKAGDKKTILKRHPVTMKEDGRFLVGFNI